ncbi:MAG: DUF5060 domain-containing protein [Acidobacteria bacterium]|nr:DUF5060 domain-containing protein [Acidobacteriota bacterium]
MAPGVNAFITASVIATLSLGGVAIGTAQRQGGAAPDVAMSGELKQWHKVTLTLTGPQADETSNAPNPFMDYRMTVTFAHESGAPTYRVQGYFAGDGNSANSSATSGSAWRAHLAPDKVGSWTYRISFVSGKGVALAAAPVGQAVAPFDGRTGAFRIAATDKRVPDLRARGRLRYAGKHYLQFAGTGEYFLKLGADSPETLLAYADFDGTVARKPQVPLHTYATHVQDWKAGDPTWKKGRGKGLIGAVNYLASKGVNSLSFLPYNAGGDGDNVWPFVTRDDKFHYDVSKLDQWQMLFDHAQQKGLYLHFKLQENEVDDNVPGNPAGRGGRGPADPGPVRESLDGGDTGPERKLYIRELVARFGYALALNWNIGEENTQSSEQQLAMALNLRDTDPYGGHHIVIHTFPNGQESVYPALLGSLSPFTGASLQMAWNAVHERTVRWVLASAQSNKPWVVANDEQGPAHLGVPPDPGYSGFAGKDAQGRDVGYTLDDIRKYALWGNLMAGGAGAEYYFGYALPDNDLVAENFRSRDKSWDYGRIAIDFFHSQKIPFWEMKNADELVGNDTHDNSRYCFAKANDVYLVYLPSGGTTSLDLSKASGQFTVDWLDPRNGGPLKKGSVLTVNGGAGAVLGTPPNSPGEDWLLVLRRG